MNGRIGMALLIFTMTLAGCAEKPAQPMTVAVEAPHGGSVFPLPGGKGNVEIVVETPKSGRTGSATILAYFYDAGMSILSPAPSDATLVLKQGGAEKSVPLRVAVGKEPGRLASEPGAFRDGLTGELSATIGGESVKVPISVR